MAKNNYKYKKIEKEFVNPYNFVSIDECPNRENTLKQDSSEELHTGSLHCKLTTMTPLAIPDTENVQEEKNGHKVYSVNKIADHVVIPGSSIRGMLRSVYEASTNSCMSTIDKDEHITKRSDIGTFSPGVLKKEKGTWKLYEAERIPLVGKADNYKKIEGAYRFFSIKENDKKKYIDLGNTKLYFGEEVFIKERNVGHKKYNKKNKTSIEVWNGKTVEGIERRSNTNCYLFLGEAILNKHAESVFKIKNNKPLEILDKDIKIAMDGLENTLNIYRNEGVNRNLKSSKMNERHLGYRGYEDAKHKGAIPIWFRKDYGHIYFSMAAIGRIAYQNTLDDISNAHAPCVSRKELCPACAVFGMVGKGKDNKGIGSKIRISDAIGQGNIKINKDITLKELASPKTSYLEFYSRDGKNYDEKDALIRGRKLYWHIPNVNNDVSIYMEPKDSKNKESRKNNRNATFDLIEKDNCFEFDVYYDGLTDEQLEMLLWSITLPDDSKQLMHKLGHGKPLGLGSVKLEVLTKNERKLIDGYKIESNIYDINKQRMPKLLHNKSWEQLKVLLEYDEKFNIEIRYPYVIPDNSCNLNNNKRNENAFASHQWFKENKKYKDSLLPEGKEGQKVMEAYDKNNFR